MSIIWNPSRKEWAVWSGGNNSEVLKRCKTLQACEAFLRRRGIHEWKVIEKGTVREVTE